MNTISKKHKNIIIYYILFLSIINNLITEKQYMVSLMKLYKNGLRTYHIHDFNQIINLFIDNNLNDSYHLSLLLNRHNDGYRHIIGLKYIFPNMMNNRINIVKILKYLKKKEKLMKSFQKNDTDMKDMMIYDMTLFEENHREDLINRLHQLSAQFGIKYLRKMNVHLLKISEIKNLNYSELKKYYDQCITMIMRTIIKYIDISEDFRIVANELDQFIKFTYYRQC